MSDAATPRAADGRHGFLFSPASSYPVPAAYVCDDAGAIMHQWSHPACQPGPEDDPPSYLRGWNHVEADADGNLFAIVPLRALLKLTPASEPEWACDVAAHHDLAIDGNGVILVLAEAPRRVAAGGRSHVILDNVVTFVGADGTAKTEVSLYDVLRADPALRRRIDDSIVRRAEQFRRRGWPAPDDDVSPEAERQTRMILDTASDLGDRRQALRRLRSLPGRPCDVMHTNTLELVAAHPGGIWAHGDVLVCMREQNTIAVVDLAHAQVRWSWGPGQLSGPHQPSVLPDGRILVFDNGVDAGRTRLLIVEPRTREVVWSWSAQPARSFFCPLAGGCEMLPNGNLLVTNSTAGAAFELTMDGRTTWQLNLPVEVYGAERGRVSIYRMSAVAPDVVARLARAGACASLSLSAASPAFPAVPACRAGRSG